MLFVFLTAVITCPGTDVSNGALVPSGPVPVNQTATVQCDVGYKLTGPPTVKCLLDSGQTTASWNGAIPGCESECAYPGMYSVQMYIHSKGCLRWLLNKVT